MITLGVLTYVIVSLLLSWSYTRTTYSLVNGHKEGMDTREAFKYGFLTIPIVCLSISLLFGLALMCFYVIVGIFMVCGWIITYMP